MRCYPFVLAALGCVAHLNGQSVPAPTFGNRVDIGGRRLYLWCAGKGTPTVILVAGGGAYAIDWGLVHPAIAATTRVCAFDRAGLGWSDPGPADETVEQVVNDLHRLLQRGGEKAPFVLVGASIGGIYIRAFQYQYPADVAGLVFANSSHRVGLNVNGKSGLLWDLSEADIRAGFPLPSTITRGPAPTKEGAPFDRLPPALQQVRLVFELKQWNEWDSAKARPESNLSWRKEFLREFDEQCPGVPPPLHALPVIVVSSDPKPAASTADSAGALRCTRDDAGRDLDRLSSNSRYLTAPGSGHEIHLFQPDAVVHAILQLVRPAAKGG